MAPYMDKLTQAGGPCARVTLEGMVQPRRCTPVPPEVELPRCFCAARPPNIRQCYLLELGALYSDWWSLRFNYFALCVLCLRDRPRRKSSSGVVCRFGVVDIL
eukprot:3707573-Amphidinium_carterae.1